VQSHSHNPQLVRPCLALHATRPAHCITRQHPCIFATGLFVPRRPLPARRRAHHLQLSWTTPAKLGSPGVCRIFFIGPPRCLSQAFSAAQSTRDHCGTGLASLLQAFPRQPRLTLNRGLQARDDEVMPSMLRHFCHWRDRGLIPAMNKKD